MPLNRDARIEELWDEFADVPFDEQESGDLVLAVEWNGFQKGTAREDV